MLPPSTHVFFGQKKGGQLCIRSVFLCNVYRRFMVELNCIEWSFEEIVLFKIYDIEYHRFHRRDAIFLIMKILLGTIIISISFSIIAFESWYNFHYMVAFGRGLPEALFHQRMIATVVTSIPFIVFIYLAFRYLIFGSNGERLLPVKSKWSLSEIALAFAGISIFWPIFSGFIVGVYFHATQKENEYTCKKMESTAHGTMAAISDYYADPEHLTLPSVDELLKEGYLLTDFPVTIEEDSNEDPVITIIDDTEECIKGKKFIYYTNGMEPEWKD